VLSELLKPAREAVHARLVTDIILQCPELTQQVTYVHQVTFLSLYMIKFMSQNFFRKKESFTVVNTPNI
jgi:hypothetical protein